MAMYTHHQPRRVLYHAHEQIGQPVRKSLRRVGVALSRRPLTQSRSQLPQRFSGKKRFCVAASEPYLSPSIFGCCGCVVSFFFFSGFFSVSCSSLLPGPQEFSFLSSFTTRKSFVPAQMERLWMPTPIRRPPASATGLYCSDSVGPRLFGSKGGFMSSRCPIEGSAMISKS